jgi:lysophospholipid acyltransferase (LPLAT)-like uncharacterized protein
MKLRQSWLIGLAALLGAAAMRILGATVWRRDATVGAPFPRNASERTIYLIWHESIILGALYKAPLHTLISQHADGELIARVCRYLGIGVIRGSASRGGAAALLGLMRRTGANHIVLTPDGPRGPRRQVKPGPVALAGMTGMPIVPVGIACPSAWRTRSWDRHMVPRPVATAHYVFGPEFRVPEGLDRDRVDQFCRDLEATLEALTDAAERWAAGGAAPDMAVTTKAA